MIWGTRQPAYPRKSEKFLTTHAQSDSKLGMVYLKATVKINLANLQHYEKTT